MAEKPSSCAKLNDHQILYLLLYLATDEGRKPLPERWQFLTSEVVGGLVEYLTGQELKDTYPHFFMPHGMEDWGDYINKSLKHLPVNYAGKISLKLILILKHMLQFSWHHDHGESWNDNQVRFIMLFGRGPIMSRTFHLTIPDAEEVKEKIIPALPSKMLEECRQIAGFMKKYIKQDIEFMDKHHLS